MLEFSPGPFKREQGREHLGGVIDADCSIAWSEGEAISEISITSPEVQLLGVVVHFSATGLFLPDTLLPFAFHKPRFGYQRAIIFPPPFHDGHPIRIFDLPNPTASL